MEPNTLNINRLEHLLNLFQISKGDLLSKISEGLANQLTEKDVFTPFIKLSRLKKVDKIFNKGLSYYFDPSDPILSKDESIFFRKDKFNSQLNLGAKQIVNKFEEEKISFSTLAKLADFKFRRTIPKK